jgi:membrane fusion protein, multidrug efflux system
VYLGIDRAPGDADVLRQGQFVQGTLGVASASLLSVPVSAVRTDKPAPYVQAIENDQIVHKNVQTGERGLAAGETVVGITGAAAGTVVVAGNIGTLREGTRVTFTKLPAAAGLAAASKPAP